jgi:signal transduction histidine kinase
MENSIHIADKNQFLTSNLMTQITEYLFEDSNSNNVYKIKKSIDQLELNIMVLRQGGKVSDLDLKPLPITFLVDWNTIYQKWTVLKTILNKTIKPNEKPNKAVEATLTKKSALEIDYLIKTIYEPRTLSLVDSSNVLVTKLDEYVKTNSDRLMFLQMIFTVLNIVVVGTLIFYIVKKILKPVFALRYAISEVIRGNLNATVKIKDNGDKISLLDQSFNSMIISLKSYIKKQNKLINELERANGELKFKEQLKDEFINVAAHELKNPIQPIIGLSEVLRYKEGNIEKDHEILDVIIRNSKRLLKLTQDILDVAKIDRGYLKKEKFDLKEMIMELLKDCELKLQNKKNIKFSSEFYDNNEISIVADRNRLCQVFSNLLNNSINFTNEGSITVIVESKAHNNNDNDNKIVVSIKDTGTGIHPEIMPKLFTTFTTKSMTDGTGLGLYISKNIIERHGGQIWATNNKEKDKGIGSTFTFSLPVK